MAAFVVALFVIRVYTSLGSVQTMRLIRLNELARFVMKGRPPGVEVNMDLEDESGQDEQVAQGGVGMPEAQRQKLSLEAFYALDISPAEFCEWYARAVAIVPEFNFSGIQADPLHLPPILPEEDMADVEIMSGPKDNAEGRVRQRRTLKRTSATAKLQQNLDKNRAQKKKKTNEPSAPQDPKQ